MKLCTALLLGIGSAAAFTIPTSHSSYCSTTRLAGYLDDLTGELRGANPNPIPEEETREYTRMDKRDVDRAGVGNWEGFVDFDEFDGGDGQMGVAGDGKKGLEKAWSGEAELGKSKSMSAKNAWGKSTGYADELMEKGVEQVRFLFCFRCSLGSRKNGGEPGFDVQISTLASHEGYDFVFFSREPSSSKIGVISRSCWPRGMSKRAIRKIWISERQQWMKTGAS
jgi:hypothetical protein